MPDAILLTGATGLLGRYLLRDLTLRGASLAVLARGDRRRTAAARIDSIMAGWEETLGRELTRPVVLEGELTAPGLGLDRDAARWLARHCLQVLHGGASLSFDGADRARDPWLTNLAGTANLLAVCLDAGVRSFHHVSTAYVCGTRSDTVTEEEVGRPASFRNDYEASKAEAERMVRAAPASVAVTVYRPAIIVGDSVTGYTSTYHGLYLYLHYLWLMSRYSPRDPDGHWRLPVRLNLTGEERWNLVPVDWVSAVTAEIVSRLELHGRTYHLTPTPAVTTREVQGALTSYFGHSGVTFAGPGALAGGDLNDAEAEFYRFVSRYERYWAAEPHFDSSNTLAAVPDRPCPPIDAPLVRRLIDFAIDDGWGRGRKGRPTAGEVAGS